jgi:predicted component of type VI protein secretion system
MVDHDVEKIVDKLQKLRALRHARERVRQLERELNGEPARLAATPPHVPEFLRQHCPPRIAK